ncbi:MAG: epimerase [Verrucomicrobia bacterium]|nr:epimerase [Verrucomicrobiota bacterium]
MKKCCCCSEPYESLEALEERLSRPTNGVMDTIRKCRGDLLIIGAGGKIGPSLATMVRRAMDRLGRKDDVIAVDLFPVPELKAKLKKLGIRTVTCNFMDRKQVEKLPDADNVIFMAGQKFGTSQGPELTWAMNTLVPEHACERYPSSRIVAYSTGCVYPLVDVKSGGATEKVPPAPPGDYANSCVGRERIFTYFSNKNKTPVAIYRLNYAIDLRYGVLVDIGNKVWKGEPLDVTMGHVNIIWQGDANARAIQCLDLAACPPVPINVTGKDCIPVRRIAQSFGKLMGRKVKLTGKEAKTAWLSNSSWSYKIFGKPEVDVDQMIAWTAKWIAAGGPSLGKPTHFESRDGKF